MIKIQIYCKNSALYSVYVIWGKGQSNSIAMEHQQQLEGISEKTNLHNPANLLRIF